MSRRSRSSKTSVTLTGLAGVVLIIIVAALRVLTGGSFDLGTVPTAVPVNSSSGNSSDSSGAVGAVVPGGELSWLKVYFTNPSPPDNVGNGVDNYVVPVLDSAKKSIDLVSFDFTLRSVTDALVNAQKRGVTVRMVLDMKNGDQQLDAIKSAGVDAYVPVPILQKAGIPIVDGGRSNGLMHNKFIIVDSTTLFVGSWNMSYNDTFRNNNNLLQITSQKLIANYQAKFNELFIDKRFGAKAKVGALTPSMTLDGVKVENYFSPVDQVMDKIVAQVNAAKRSVRFMIFTYTDKTLSAAMIAQAKAGLAVQGVIENLGASQGAMPALFCAKLPVKTDGNQYTLHHKVIIIDDETVITGSFNFTKSADDSNDDNILIIHSPAIAALYKQEWDRVYSIGKTPDKVSCTTT